MSPITGPGKYFVESEYDQKVLDDKTQEGLKTKVTVKRKLVNATALLTKVSTNVGLFHRIFDVFAVGNPI